jgi:hypothetical protein
MSIIISPELLNTTTCRCSNVRCMWFRLMLQFRGFPHTVDVTFLRKYVSKRYVPYNAATVHRVSESSTLSCILDQRTVNV